MAKLHFYYSTMNAGKSTNLLQASYNYQERGMKVAVFTARLDDRYGEGQVTSRIGLSAKATLFESNDNLFQRIRALCAEEKLACILVDESQFLTKAQVFQLSDVVDDLHIPVICYGLRTDFMGELFPGSMALLAIADEMREIKTICHCGRKATMVVRRDANGKVITHGAQICIGGNETYVALCRKHWKEEVGYICPEDHL